MTAGRPCAIIGLLLAAACSPRPDDLAREAAELRGECTVEGLRHADDACVEAFARGTARLEDAMEVYAGALRTLQRLADERGMDLDTSFAYALPSDAWPGAGASGDTGAAWGTGAPLTQPGRRPFREEARSAGAPADDWRHQYPGVDGEPRYPGREPPASSYESLAERRAAAYEEMLARRGGGPDRTEREPPARGAPDRRFQEPDRYGEPERFREPLQPGGYLPGAYPPGAYPPGADARPDGPDCRRLEADLRRSMAGNAPIDIQHVAAMVRLLEAWCAQPYRQQRSLDPRG